MADQPTPQLDRDDLADMDADAIVQANADGKLDQLLGRPPRPHANVQLGRDDLTQMTPDQIVAAHNAGQLDEVLGR